MRDHKAIFAALLTAAALLGPRAALGQTSRVTARETTKVPVNVGLVPYVDINSHFVRPENNFSLDGIVGAAAAIDGVSIAGVSGFAWQRVRGLQIGGVSGYAGNVSGVQIGGVVSAARGAADGLQVGGVVNYAGSLHGAQIGLVNVGGRVRGLQLGLVNVADEVEGATIGLINVVRNNGRHQIEVSTSNTAAITVATKLGTRHVYSILGMGLQPAKGRAYWMPTVGIGGSIPIVERGFVNIELLASQVNAGAHFDRYTTLVQLRAAGGYRLTDRLSLFGGPVLDMLRSRSGKRLSDISYLPALGTFRDGSVPVDLGLGFVVGLEAL